MAIWNLAESRRKELLVLESDLLEAERAAARRAIGGRAGGRAAALPRPAAR